MAESARTIFLSLIETVVELIVVVVPSTCRSPRMITLPVLSPTPAGSIVKLAGPAIYPLTVKLLSIVTFVGRPIVAVLLPVVTVT